MNIMLALDSAMGIFHNCPPRINYCELDLQMPCLPEYFELSCYSEMLQRSMFPRTRMKLIDAFQRLFAPPEELKFAFQNEMLCCWDMLYLIHGMYGPTTMLKQLRESYANDAHLLCSAVHSLLATSIGKSAKPRIAFLTRVCAVQHF